jgi:hypothetical protein
VEGDSLSAVLPHFAHHHLARLQSPGFNAEKK